MKIELTIHGVAASASDADQMMLLLREKDGSRMLPVMMSHRRAMLLMARDRVPLSIPFPVSVSDICHLLMQQMGTGLKHVEISAVKDGHLFCNVVAEADGQEYSVDYCQAPDGLVMAVTFRCPIMIEEELLESQYMHNAGNGSFAMNLNTLTLQMLEDALEQAVASEKYEQASFLRDEIRRRREDKDPATTTTLDSLFPEDSDNGASE